MSIALANKASQEDADAAVEALKAQFEGHDFSVNADGNPPRFRITLDSELGVAREGEETKVTDTPTVESMRRVAQTAMRKERVEAAQRRAAPRIARGGRAPTAARTDEGT